MDEKKLQDMLIKHEGYKTKPYIDTVGKMTIGVGHNLTDLGLSGSQIIQILNDDIKTATDFLDSKLPWWKSLDEVRQRALTDMAFNLGGKLLGFQHFLAALQSKDFKTAKVEMLSSTWAAQVGPRAIELSKMIETGQD